MPQPAESKTQNDGMGSWILCGCGCGQKLHEFDERARQRRFINGHYARMIWRLYAEAKAKGTEPFR